VTDIGLLPCPECGRPIGEHTPAEQVKHATSSGLTGIGETVSLPPNAPIVDGLTLASGVLTLGDEGDPHYHPAVTFTFQFDDHALPPIVFAPCDGDGLVEIAEALVAHAELARLRTTEQTRGAT